MKRYATLLIIAFLFASCSGGDDEKGTTLHVSAEWPPEFAGLDASAFKLYGTLLDNGTAVVSDVSGAASEGGYIFDVGKAGSGGRTLDLSVKYASAGAEYVIGKAAKAFDIRPGEVGVIVSAADFTNIGGGDLDGDGMDNLAELKLGLDPMLADTDRDGRKDGADVFPSLAAEWLDTDGDGIGDNADGDIDGDGLDNDAELALGTDKAKADTDADGAADMGDNCRLKSNAAQTDTDGDGMGDACDDDSDGDGLTNQQEAYLRTDPLRTDTDGDGLSDKLEFDAGLNPLAEDTDGDGRNDKTDKFPLNAAEWDDADSDGIGDNSDNCIKIANSAQANYDGDIYGDACDGDIDGNGLPYVYVDAERGDDANLGAYNSPVRTMQRAIILAYERNNEDVIAAGGSYDIADVVFKSGVHLKGGYDGGRIAAINVDPDDYRDIRSDVEPFYTELGNSKSTVTLHLSNAHQDILIEGFHIINSAAGESSETVVLENTGDTVVIQGCTVFGNEGAALTRGVYVISGSPKIDANWIERKTGGVESIGILIEGGSPVVTNNIVRAGSARHAKGVVLKESSAVIVNNSIDGTSYAATPLSAAGLVFEDAAPAVVNNIIAAMPMGDGDAIAMKCFGASPDAATFRNNIFTTFSEGTSDALFADCDGQFHYDASFAVGESVVAGNIAYSADFAGLWDGGYELAGAFGAGQGIDADLANYGLVRTDFDSNERLRGAYDIGAKE